MTKFTYSDDDGKECSVDEDHVTQHSNGSWYDDDGHECQPHSDGIVSGAAGNDLIDYNYTGDPDGDKIDHNDAVLAGAAPQDD